MTRFFSDVNANVTMWAQRREQDSSQLNEFDTTQLAVTLFTDTTTTTTKMCFLCCGSLFY